MKTQAIAPEQILTLTDFPVHSTHVLKIYHRMFAGGAGNLVPPCPVMSISLALPFLSTRDDATHTYNACLERFLKSHREVKFVLVDGNHRSTSAALAHHDVPAFELERSRDIHEARELVADGELLGLSVSDSGDVIAETLTLQDHFRRTPRFETVTEKTDRMVNSGILPNYLTRSYRHGRPT